VRYPHKSEQLLEPGALNGGRHAWFVISLLCILNLSEEDKPCVHVRF